MQITVGKVAKTLNIKSLTYIMYVFGVFIVSDTLISEHQQAAFIYFIYPVLMLFALFTTSHKLKRFTSVAAMALIIFGGVIEPLELDAIEESFILIPLLYIILFPGSLWPISTAVILVLSYLHNLPAEDFDEFVEDAIEVLAISVFASVMVYYQIQSRNQMRMYQDLSNTDVITEIPNRRAFFNHLEEVKKNKVDKFALLQMDLTRFKYVNDSLGHQYGDSLLRAFSNRVLGMLSNEDSFYRIGGNEFAIIVQAGDDLGDRISELEYKLKHAYQPLFHLEESSYSLQFSTGIALLDDAMGDVELWCKNCDLATNKAKSKSNDSIQWYDDELLEETIRSHQIQHELKLAIEQSQFDLAYQPKVDIKTGELLGAEGLIRWIHPELGFISPAEFITIAERTTQIIPIGRWVVDEACSQIKDWRDKGWDLSISVNVSTVQFMHDDIFKVVKESIEKHGIPAERLELEVTETTLMTDPESVALTCEKLRKLGLTISIDDFGVAYSSLNYLKKLPIDVLKIDKSFVDDCVTNHNDHMLIRTIIQMGHNMGKVVVAEGVETSSQLALLKGEGCDMYQGYYFSKPLFSEEFEQKFKPV